nr:reverse transcriptase domain-containing protein [Tanacetum cinerariifolium]
MSHLSQLAFDANSNQLIYIVTLLFHNDNQRDFQLVRDTYVSCQHLMVRCEERNEQILELQNLVGSTVVTECVRLLQKFQQDDLESSRGMMRPICKTQLKVQLLVVLERANIFQKNGIGPSKYTITFRLADNVPKQGAYLVIVMTDDSTEKYSLFKVNYDGMFDELPLRYAYGKVLPLKLSNLNRMTYSEILDMLVYKLECEIRALVYSIPRNSLKTGLTIVECDNDVKKEKEQSISPLLRTPPLKKRRKGISFQGKNLYADFLHADCVDDHFDFLDHWSYEDVYGGGCFDVGGSFKGFDCIEESVGCDDGSLPVKLKDEFENKVILDDVVSSPPNLSMLLKRKGQNRASWSDKLEDALWAFRTAYKTPIGCTPYKLVYGKACHLPMELEHKAYWALKQTNLDLTVAGKSLFTRFGAPRAIISDRGIHFCNDQFSKVMLKYGGTHRLSTVYHPQTSGQVEEEYKNSRAKMIGLGEHSRWMALRTF